MFLHFVALIVLVLDTTEASLNARESSKMQRISDRKTTESPRECLYPPIDLPACNFGTEDDKKVEKLSRQRRVLAELENSEMYEDSEQLSIKESPKDRYSRAVTTVYKIEGCIPSRLPFVIPLCKREDFNGRIRVRKLLPFKVSGQSNGDYGAPLVFPELDMDQWNQFMHSPWIRPSSDKDNAESKKSPAEESEDPVKMPKRKKVNDSSLSEKKIRRKSTSRQEAKKFNANNGFLKFRASLAKGRGMRDREGNSFGKRNEKRYHTNGLTYVEDKHEEEKLRRLLIEKVSTRYHDEFPYEVAIPYDPSKLQIARPGSEFPYSRAIPYDPKKLEERREAERSIPFWTRRLKVLEMKPSTFRDVPFDASMLDAAKDGGTFPYAKDKPDDTSKIIETMEQPKSSEMEKIKVPVRHVMTMLNDGDPTAEAELTRKIRDTKTDEQLERDYEIRSHRVEASIRNRFNIAFKRPRFSRSPIESSMSNLSSISSDSLEIPRRWSEFPYGKAIPFDPEKLRRPRSTMENRNTREITIPHDFPYSKAIPYDPRKLNAARRKKSQTRDDPSSNDEKIHLDRLTRTASSI